MKLDTFFENFGLLADAPNGVQKLREMILQLAVQGKLVPQDPKDEPASTLLEKIKVEKKRLVKEKKIKKSKTFSPIKSDTIFYELPDSWEWTRLAEIGLINPRNDVGNETEVSFVPMKLVPTVLGDRVESEIRQWGDIKNGFTHFSEGDVALAKITPCFQNRKSAVMRGLKNGLGAGTTELHIFRPIKDLIISEYVLLYLKTPKFIKEGVSKMTGSAGQKRVPKTYFSETPFPLPPKQEQKRIVAKVDKLMALCDELEARKQQVSKNCIQLNDASIHKLLTTREPKKFSKHWQRICENFDLLYSKPENVTKLRQAILQLAVQGKLVPQDPRDEPASVLLEKIKAEKERLIKEGKIRKMKQLPAIDPDEIPYPVPMRWEWEKIERLCFVTKLAGFEYTKYINLSDFGEVPVIRAQNVRRDRIDDSNLKYIDLKTSQSLARSALTRPSILMTFIGAGIGDVAIFNKRSRWHLAPNVAKLEPYNFYSENLDIRYLLIYLMSEVGRGEIFKHRKATAQPSLSMATIRDVNVAIPPLSEQKRIVVKVDELMALCDELETRLSQSQTDCDRLIEAAVAEILAA